MKRKEGIAGGGNGNIQKNGGGKKQAACSEMEKLACMWQQVHIRE